MPSMENPGREKRAGAALTAHSAGTNNRIIQVYGIGNTVYAGSNPILELIHIDGLRREPRFPAAYLNPGSRHTTFVGRERELESLKSWLDSSSKISLRVII